jgi:transcriptional regulator with XRE-family HTH domain
MQANGQFLTHDYGPWITITFDACFLTEEIANCLGLTQKTVSQYEPKSADSYSHNTITHQNNS